MDLRCFLNLRYCHYFVQGPAIGSTTLATTVLGSNVAGLETMVDITDDEPLTTIVQRASTYSGLGMTARGFKVPWSFLPVPEVEAIECVLVQTSPGYAFKMASSAYSTILSC